MKETSKVMKVLVAALLLTLTLADLDNVLTTNKQTERINIQSENIRNLYEYTKQLEKELKAQGDELRKDISTVYDQCKKPALIETQPPTPNK